MFRKVLVCLDGSGLAEQTLPYATEVAKRFGSSMVLLQVLHVPSSLAAASAQGAESVIEEEMRRLAFDARTYLEQVAAGLRDAGIPADAVTVEGTPGDAIVEYATTHEVDLIAIATHGRRNIGRLVFGSVADHVIRNSGIPVLSVTPRETKE
jgi:nucleotide-binding universal stress UspA family protein